ncbi:MAG: hypothetical protein LBG26_06600, partial [Treponema sp.]|nr:hypothetical protein [Treponema sp.]
MIKRRQDSKGFCARAGAKGKAHGRAFGKNHGLEAAGRKPDASRRVLYLSGTFYIKKKGGKAGPKGFYVRAGAKEKRMDALLA